MKLLQKTLIVMALIASFSGLTMLTTGQAGAQTQSQATSCYNKWDTDKTGKKIAASTIESDMTNTAATCWQGNGGSCVAVNAQEAQHDAGPGNDGSAKFAVTCSKNPSKASNTNNKTTTTTAGSCTTTSSSGGESSEVCSDPATVCSKSSGDCDIVGTYINPIIITLSILVGLAVTIGIIWGGVQVSMSAGDPQKNALGRKHIQDALIALVTFILFYTFLNWIIPGGI